MELDFLVQVYGKFSRLGLIQIELPHRQRKRKIIALIFKQPQFIEKC